MDKRLDLDLDEMLNSQTLEIKLSPAELDKQLLELYNSVVQGPRGDVFRVIGGGTDVGKQFLYLQQQAIKRKKQEQQQLRHDKAIDVVYDEVENVTTAQSNHDDNHNINQSNLPAERVKRTIQRNLLLPSTFTSNSDKKSRLFEINLSSPKKRKKDELEMSLIQMGRRNGVHKSYSEALGVGSRGYKFPSTFICRSSFTSVFRPKIR